MAKYYVFVCNVTLRMLSTCITRSFNECTCLWSSVYELLRGYTIGMITQLPPIKSSRKNPTRRYFDLNLTDGKKTVRAVSFNSNLGRALEDLKEEATVHVSNCDVKEEEEEKGMRWS